MLRFSDYDIFAYVVSGIAAILAVDVVVGTHFMMGATWTVSQGIVLVIAAYVVGQILAAPSSWIIERRLVRRVLGRPTDALLRIGPLRGWRAKLSRSILADYYNPLDRATGNLLRALMKRERLLSGEELFWRAFPAIKCNEIAYSRVEAFLKLYGFCRNMAFVALLSVVALAGSATVVAIRDGPAASLPPIGWALASLLVGVGMLLRYLKFRRLYVVEVLTTFADLLRLQDGPAGSGQLKENLAAIPETKGADLMSERPPDELFATPCGPSQADMS